MAKVLVVFYSRHGHTLVLAEAIAEGARSVEEVQVDLKRVSDTVPLEVVEATPAWKQVYDKISKVPEVDPNELGNYDGIITGSPTRFGNMGAPLQDMWDKTADIWMSGALIGKVGAAFCTTGSVHGGAETTVKSMWSPMIHQGMIIMGVPYSVKEIFERGSPYGPSFPSGPDGSKQPLEEDFVVARALGKRVAETAKKLHG